MAGSIDFYKNFNAPLDLHVMRVGGSGRIMLKSEKYI